MATLPEIKTTSIRYSVAEILRAAIREGRFVPGEDLSEVKLAAELKVSRGPIREAMLVLTEEGLLTYSQNRGFHVLELTAEDRANIDRVRLPLEILALQSAKERCTPADLRRLQKLKDQLIQQIRKGPFSARDSAEIAFHSAIWNLSGNEWLVAALQRIMVPYFTYGRVLQLTTPRPDLMADQHQAYLDFLSGESKATAEECVRFHLTGTSAFPQHG
ncbi:MAG: GntR family transcriptional regulator [Bryobacteraceae bacterium]